MNIFALSLPYSLLDRTGDLVKLAEGHVFSYYIFHLFAGRGCHYHATYVSKIVH